MRILQSHCRIFEFELATRYSSVAALLVKCVMAKWGAELISPSPLANILKRSKECHERFRPNMGEWTESSNESSAESKAPKLNPPKEKLKLSLPKARKIDGKLWIKQRK